MGTALAGRTSEVRYARVDGAHVAYRVIDGPGAATQDVVLVLAGTMPMQAMFDDPVGLRLLEGLADLGRLVVFDRRGIGMSDPPPDGSALATFAEWCDDLEAVSSAARLERPVLMSNLLGASVTLLYCSRHPDDVTSIVSLEPAQPRVDLSVVRGQIDGEIDSVAYLCPSRAEEPGFREWFNRAGQIGASPRMAERAYPGADEADVHEIERAARELQVPMLVLRRPANPLSPERSRDPILRLVPNATRIDIPGEDLVTYGGEVDALLAEVSRFVTGEHRLPAPDRALAALLYSDLVASTDRATALGDARWKRLLDRHDEIAQACIGRRGGTVIKTTGDGVLAIFRSATSALRAAHELRAALLEEQLEVRISLHVGDVDQRGDDVSGLGVVIAARILDLAEAGEILASGTAVGAVTGSHAHFEPRGDHSLKGVPETWALFASVPSA